MRKWKLLLVGFLIGVVSFAFLPLGFKIFGFLVPVVIYCNVLSKDDDNFNVVLFVVLLFIYILIPSNLFTFDASKGIDYRETFVGVYSIISVLSAVVFFGVPIFMCVGIVWSFIIGRVDKSTSQLVKLILILGFLMFFLAILNVMGFTEQIPFLSGVTDFYIALINLCFRFPYYLYNIIDSVIDVFNSVAEWTEVVVWVVLRIEISLPRIPNLPDLPFYQMPEINLTFDGTYAHFSAMDYNETLYAVHDSLPIFMAFTCLITSLFMIKEDWEEAIIEFVTELSLEEAKPIVKDRSRFSQLNYNLTIYAWFIFFFGLIIFLGYIGAYGSDYQNDWRMIGYVSIYLILVLFSWSILTRKGWTNYTDSTIKNTVVGVIVGLTVLVFFTRLFSTQTVMSAFSVLNLSKDMSYIATTFVFVAPAESLFFHITYPGLIEGRLESYSEEKYGEVAEETRYEELRDLESQKKLAKRFEKIAKESGDKRDYAVAQKVLNDIEQDTIEKEDEAYEMAVDKKMELFGRKELNFLYHLIAIVGGAFLFAIVHWIIPAVLYDLDFWTFWMSGLGVIYLCGGAWFIYIGNRWGWMACIQTHAIFNTLTILLVLATMGV